MEFVEGYVHRGWVNCGKDGEEYDKPWKWLKTDKGMIYGLLFWENLNCKISFGDYIGTQKIDSNVHWRFN